MEDNPADFLIAEEGNGLIGRVLQIAEANYIAKGLDGVQDPVGA